MQGKGTIKENKTAAAQEWPSIHALSVTLHSKTNDRGQLKAEKAIRCLGPPFISHIDSILLKTCSLHWNWWSAGSFWAASFGCCYWIQLKTVHWTDSIPGPMRRVSVSSRFYQLVYCFVPTPLVPVKLFHIKVNKCQLMWRALCQCLPHTHTHTLARGPQWRGPA